MSRKILSALSSFALVLSLSMVPSGAVWADGPDAAMEGKTKINLAGRQRMLSQRMAKAACFAKLGVQTDTHLTMLADAHGLFDRTLAGLRHGDSAQGMGAETSSVVLGELGKVENLWAGYGKAVKAVIDTGTVTDAQLKTIADLNGPVLRQMHTTVGMIETAYGSGGSVHPSLALALNVSGRQRMLSQRASKEFCLVVAGVDEAANRQALTETVTLFDRSLNGLINGDMIMGLAAAPTPQIKAQLEKVQALWAPLSETLRETAAGQTPTDAQIATVSGVNNTVLVEMNAAVTLYNQL